MTIDMVKLICNECRKIRMVSANGNYNDRCPKCAGVDWDVLEPQHDEFFDEPIPDETDWKTI